MVKVLVECKFQIEIEVPDSWANSGNVRFMIEDNGCPGTGLVGAAIDKKMAEHEAAGTCWACAALGTNRIIAIDG